LKQRILFVSIGEGSISDMDSVKMEGKEAFSDSGYR
jgi:hypothetical protein